MITRNALSQRIRAEYLEMPGMILTTDQVSRLCGMERSACQTVLDALVDAQFLTLKSDGTYVRRTGEMGRTRTAPPQLHDDTRRVTREAS
jgi:hypothetical protein